MHRARGRPCHDLSGKRRARRAPRRRAPAALARLAAGATALRAGSPAPEPSPFFAARLAARIAALPPRRRGLRRLLPAHGLRLALAAAAAVAIAGGASFAVLRGR